MRGVITVLVSLAVTVTTSSTHSISCTTRPLVEYPVLKKLSLEAASLIAGAAVVAGEGAVTGELVVATAAKTPPGTYVSVDARLEPAECESVGTGLPPPPFPAAAPLA